jgi:membrane protein DedA with SNARE-associated domain
VTEAVIGAVASLGVPALYVLVAGLAFGETAFLAGLVVPGEVGLVVAGAAVRGQGSLGLAIAAGVAGALLGDSTGYLLGRRFGKPIVCRWDWARRRLEPRIERAEDYFQKRGGVAILLGRWIGAVRALIALVAGTSGMPYRRFLPWDVAGAASWAAIVTTLGYVFGPGIARTVDRYAGALSVAAVACLVAWWLLRGRKQRPRPEAAGVR